MDNFLIATGDLFSFVWAVIVALYSLTPGWLIGTATFVVCMSVFAPTVIWAYKLLERKLGL